MEKRRLGPSLRACLKRETAQSHCRLDSALAGLALGESADYAWFLHFQLAARAPIERWAAQHCAPALRPPETVPLLLADLERLGAGECWGEAAFDPPPGAHPLGLAWAVAGSHLGNRAQLSHLARSGAVLPTAFLSDPQMIAFWARLRPAIDAPADEALLGGALAAAEAVFACFSDALEAAPERIAA